MKYFNNKILNVDMSKIICIMMALGVFFFIIFRKVHVSMYSNK